MFNQTMLKKYLFACLSIAIFAVGCTNRGLDKLTQDLNSLSIAPPFGNGNVVTLSHVVKANFDPFNSIELIGDNSGAIGSLCTGTGGVPGPCECYYEYTKPDGTQEALGSAATYVERDMMRCNYNLIPSGVTTLRVSLRYTTNNAFSNKVTFTFSGNGTPIDLALSSSYLSAKRYQCRDFVTIFHMFCDGSGSGDNKTNCAYDPLQSESTRYSYPLDFYTTNVGGSLLSLFNQSAKTPSLFAGWECATDSNNQAAWENPFLYSLEGSPSSGSKLIDPPLAGDFDRRNFLLAKQSSGVFNVPLNALTAPKILTTSPDDKGNQPSGTFPPIGYAAKPISNGNGTESCPVSQVTLPSGYHWVKVWAFQGSINPRRYINITPEVLRIGGIFCNPGDYPGTLIPVAADCDDSGGDTDHPLSGVTSLEPLASRILGSTNACVRFPDNGLITSHAAGQSDTSSTNYADGSDLWERIYHQGQHVVQNGIPWNLRPVINNATNAVADFEEDDQSVPYDSAIPSTLPDLDGGQSRTDYVFVVSPTSVNSITMLNRLSGSGPYTPYRYETKDACPDPDPDSSATCAANAAKKITYQLWTSSIGQAGITNVFPLCAIQKDSL